MMLALYPAKEREFLRLQRGAMLGPPVSFRGFPRALHRLGALLPGSSKIHYAVSIFAEPEHTCAFQTIPKEKPPNCGEKNKP